MTLVAPSARLALPPALDRRFEAAVLVGDEVVGSAPPDLVADLRATGLAVAATAPQPTTELAAMLGPVPVVDSRTGPGAPTDPGRIRSASAVLHVDDEASIPSFSDQVQHETEAYAREFLARHVRGAPDARLELRVGAPADEIVAAADAFDPALIALGWPHTDDPDRGQVAREVLDRSHHPVLLVAVR